MIKKIALLIYNLLFFFLRIFDFLFKKRLAYVFKDLIVEDSYEYIFINKKKIFFFIPNSFTKYRLDTFFTKEPDTLKWISNFKKNSIFFDVGANVGIYSIYASIINPSIKIFSFEPSFLNTKVLSRNISINNLSKKITIIQLPLSDKKSRIQQMSESSFQEGGSFNSFGVNFNSGVFKKKINKYSIIGTNLNDLISRKIIPIPNYIKIDVDGIEHLILNGANKFLYHKSVRSILVELYPEFKIQYNSSINILKKNGFLLKSILGLNHIFEKNNL